MNKEFHTALTEAAPQTMQRIIKLYGFFYWSGEYYNTYLLNATVIEKGYMHPVSIIEYLQENYDNGLEYFKMNIDTLLGHLNANGYIFYLSSMYEDEYTNGETTRPARRIYFARIFKLETDFASAKPITTEMVMSDDGTAHMQESCLQAAILVAIKHLEQCYVEELKLKQTA